MKMLLAFLASLTTIGALTGCSTEPQAPGQTLVLYRPDPDGDEVLGSATIAGTRG